MRVFKINDSDAYAGRTMLQAVRAAMSDSDLSFREVFDRDHAQEIPREVWPTKMLRNLEDHAREEYISLEQIMAGVTTPQMVFTNNW
jgi:hypothetical protein